MDNATPYSPEVLVQYLDGELQGADKAKLEEILSSNAQLQEQLEDLQATREAVRVYGMQQQVSAIHQQMMEEMAPPVRSISPVRRILRYSVAAAASIVLIAGIFFAYTFYNLSANRIFNNNYKNFELNDLRGSGTAQTEIETAYRANDYKKVTQLAAGSTEAEAQFLAGNAWVQMDNFPKAIEAFNKVIALEQPGSKTTWKDQAEYDLALAYIRNRDYDQSLELLHKIQNDPAHLYHDQVSNALIRQVKLLKWR